MRKWLILLLVLALCGCAAPVPMTTAPETSIPETMLPETTVPETTVPATTAPTEPLHSVLYREGFEAAEFCNFQHIIPPFYSSHNAAIKALGFAFFQLWIFSTGTGTVTMASFQRSAQFSSSQASLTPLT